jgi:hypothetical protein
LLYRESEARHSAMFRSQDPFFLRYYKACFHTLLIALKTIIYRQASGVPIELRLCFIIFLDFSEVTIQNIQGKLGMWVSNSIIHETIQVKRLNRQQ